MKKLLFFPAVLAGILLACQSPATPDSKEAENEIRQAETDFADMAVSQGVAAAFTHFADSNAVIKRGKDSLIYGKAGIAHYYAAPHFKNARVSWSPDFVSVSAGGDLGYTFGKYVWINTDSVGNTTQSTGIFHTVWKRQADGSWRYVWD